jgi:hypothetical protein
LKYPSCIPVHSVNGLSRRGERAALRRSSLRAVPGGSAVVVLGLAIVAIGQLYNFSRGRIR